MKYDFQGMSAMIIIEKRQWKGGYINDKQRKFVSNGHGRMQRTFYGNLKSTTIWNE